MTDRCITIGGACGFWGDSGLATGQLLAYPGMQYLVYDYLAETTLAIMSRARLKRPELGYATDFTDTVVTNHLAQSLRQGIKLVANAGGLNPLACRDAVLAIARAQGLEPRVAVVLGDDILAEGTIDAQTQTQTQTLSLLPATLPSEGTLWSANVYLGAQSIALALRQGADIVITGRCVDSALTVGILAYEFDWNWRDWDRLAAATLAGHVIECGAQATGGLFTDWHRVPDWDNMGYPVIRCREDGSFVLTKPQFTGGLVHHGAVSEQILYEIADPAAYLMPDVSCDFTQVQVRQLDVNQVAVSGARGRRPTSTYKANATWQDGFQIQLMLAIRGMRACEKAHKTARALIERTRRMLIEQGQGDYTEVHVELLGTGSHYPLTHQQLDVREVVLRIAARHPQRSGLLPLQRECASSGTSMGPGTKSSFGGRAAIAPVVRVESFLVPKCQLTVEVHLDSRVWHVGVESGDDSPVGIDSGADPLTLQDGATSTLARDPAVCACHPTESVRLVDLAWARSGDKGDTVNIGVIARDPCYLPWIASALTIEAMVDWLGHLVCGTVQRFDVPGLHALNFVLHQALGGGGSSSLRSDPLGKSFAQIVLEMPVTVPAGLVSQKWSDGFPGESSVLPDPMQAHQQCIAK